MFISIPFLKIFEAFFTTFGMQKDDKITFYSRCFRTKRQFPEYDVRRVGLV